MLANNLTASASVGFVNKTSIFSFNAPSTRSFANVCAACFIFSLLSGAPTIILEGYKLSYNALPSRKNSGEKIIFSVSYFFLTLSVYPTGTVDLITIIASLFTLRTSSITCSTDEVSK